MSTHAPPHPATVRPRTVSGTFLRRALQLDAAVTGANGLAYVAAAGPLAALFEVDVALLRGIGAFLLVFAAGLAYLSSRPALPIGAVWTVIGLNVLWALDSVAFAALDLATPATVGTVWVVLQAIVVLGFAELQIVGARRAGRRSS